MNEIVFLSNYIAYLSINLAVIIITAFFLIINNKKHEKFTEISLFLRYIDVESIDNLKQHHYLSHIENAIQSN